MATCSLFLSGCVHGLHLRTSAAEKADFPGTYSLILYGGNYSGDIQTVAILDKEGDRFAFEPYAPPFNYKVITGQTADHAIPRAEQFIRSNPSYQGEILRNILDPQGNIIGYELRPLYLPFVYGISDVLDIDYWMKDDKVIVSIRPKPFLEQQDGSDLREGSRGDGGH